MSKQRKGGRFTTRERHFARVRIGKRERLVVALPTCHDEVQADQRAALVAEVVNILLAGEQRYLVDEFARAVGAAKTDREIKARMIAARRIVETGPGVDRDVTFQQFGERWTSGRLHRDYPDHVRSKRTSDDDGFRLVKHIYPVVGPVPLTAFRLEHAEAVMRKLPEGLSPASRRHVAQVMQKVLRYAVYPARVISVSPLPAGFLPKVGAPKAKPYLYPDEDAKLLACKAVPLAYRVLYGVLGREGFRYDEALGTDWADWDLVRGAVNLEENKTDDPRSWALDPSVVIAMKAWKKLVTAKTAPSRPFYAARHHHPADIFREHLKAAGVTRAELFKTTDTRKRIGVHELRGTFVTLSLANGKTETWVQDRTGHKSTLMIARYRRVARTVGELGLGALKALHLAIPELAAAVLADDEGGIQGGSNNVVAFPVQGGSVGQTSVNSKEVPKVGLEPTRGVTPADFETGEAVAGGGGDSLLSSEGDGSGPPRRVAAHVAAPLRAAADGLARQTIEWATYDTFTVLCEEDES